jgi:hypothetical protein
VRAIGRCEIGGDRIGAAPGVANLRDDRFRIFHGAAVVHQDLSPGFAQRKSGCASDATRAACYQCSLS